MFTVELAADIVRNLTANSRIQDQCFGEFMDMVIDHFPNFHPLVFSDMCFEGVPVPLDFEESDFSKDEL